MADLGCQAEESSFRVAGLCVSQQLKREEAVHPTHSAYSACVLEIPLQRR